MRVLPILFFVSHILFGQTDEITFMEHISPIIYNKCTECHRPGEVAPYSFTEYAEVLNHALDIKSATESGYMPPWQPDPNYTTHALLGERFLTIEEKDLISQWVEGGGLEGDPNLEAEMPFFSEGSAIGEPDLVFTMESEYLIEGNNMDDYRVFVFPTNFEVDTFIRAIEFRPDNREAVHHAIMMADPNGEGASLDAESPYILGYESFGGFSLNNILPNEYVFLGGYAPGMNPVVWNGELGMKIPAGSDILCQVHYAPSSIDELDQSSINIFFKEEEVTREVQMKMWVRLDLEVPANQETVIEACLNFYPNPSTPQETFLDFLGPPFGEQYCELPEDWSLLGILPHSHLMGESWEVYAETPTGDIIPIIKIPDWDFDWQGFYYPEYMQYIPKDSQIKAIATYNNTSDDNMAWGENTTDEMFFCPIYYVPYQEGDESIYLGPNIALGPVFENRDATFRVFPNPSNEFIQIDFQFETKSDLKGKIYDSKGRLIKNILSENFHTELNSVKLNIATLLPGVYFINIQSDTETVTRRFIKK